MAKARLARFDAPTPLRLSLIWASLLGLFLYNDYFSLYLPGAIDSIEAGVMGSLGEATPSVMVGVAMLMAIPALMIALSVLLPAPISRWANILAGLAFTGLNTLTLVDAPLFYRLIVALELLLTLWLVYTAWRWPRPD